MMTIKDQRQFWRNDQLNFNFLEAYHFEYAYPRHSHDHYVISLIQDGVQSFTHKGTKYTTPPNGLILINPGIVHTGEPATEEGFKLRSIYPTLANMEAVAYELTGWHQTIPYFRDVRVDDVVATRMIAELHETLKTEPDPFVYESRFLATMAYLVKHFADIRLSEKGVRQERESVRKARQYLEENFSATVRLDDLAQYVALSPYHLLRVFHAEVGIPPHAYLQDVRIRKAQSLLEDGVPPAEVALAVGFYSQSHLNRHFKRVVGVTPKQYSNQILTC